MKGRNVSFLTWRCLEKLAVHLSWTDTSTTGVTGRNDQGQARMSKLGMVGRRRRRDKNILKWSRTGSDKYSTIKWWENKRRQNFFKLNNDDKEHKKRGANRETRSQQWFLMTKDWWSKLKNSDRELHYFKKHTKRTSLMEFSSDKRILRQFRRLLQIRHDKLCAWTVWRLPSLTTRILKNRRKFNRRQRKT